MIFFPCDGVLNNDANYKHVICAHIFMYVCMCVCIYIYFFFSQTFEPVCLCHKSAVTDKYIHRLFVLIYVISQYIFSMSNCYLFIYLFIFFVIIHEINNFLCLLDCLQSCAALLQFLGKLHSVKIGPNPFFFSLPLASNDFPIHSVFRISIIFQAYFQHSSLNSHFRALRHLAFYNTSLDFI